MNWSRLVDSRQMGELDRLTIAAGTPGEVLMERAGAAVCAAIAVHFGAVAGRRVLVLCGPGNNGGDGFVVARRLAAWGALPTVLLAADRGQLRGDAALHARRLEAAGVPIVALPGGAGPAPPLAQGIGEAELIVDALLGTGLAGAPRPAVAPVIESLATARCPVVAVDVPSGLAADSGAVPGPCVRAALTVTFGLPKVGLLLYPGRAYCGRLEIADIGLDPAAVAACACRDFLLDAAGVAGLLPARPGDAHKGSCGTAVVIAGSVGMTGAAALSAESALRSGAGKVLLGVPESLNDILEVKITEAMTRPLPEVRRHRCLALRGLGQTLDLMAGADAAAIGPGVGRHRETVELLRRLLVRAPVPLVVDADALFALAGATQLLAQRPAPTVLTPHYGEFARLSGLTVAQIAAQPREAARRFAVAHGVILVLKGAPTLVAGPQGDLLVNPTGNPGMATAGAGDVLTGLIAGLAAQGAAPADAAAAAVYIHGLAGDLARDRFGERGLTAGDIAALVPRATCSLSGGRSAPGSCGLPVARGRSA